MDRLGNGPYIEIGLTPKVEAWIVGGDCAIFRKVLKLFDRYILKDILPAFLIGLLVYSFLLLMNQILLLSEILITRGVSLSVVLSLLFYLLPLSQQKKHIVMGRMPIKLFRVMNGGYRNLKKGSILLK